MKHQYQRTTPVREVFCLAFMAACAVLMGAPSVGTLTNTTWTLTLSADGAVTAQGPGGVRPFEPRFMVLFSAQDPKYELRWADLGSRAMENKYNVATWATGTPSTRATAKATAKSKDQHVADGFDLRTDQTAGEERTFDVFRAGESTVVLPARASLTQGRFEFVYPDHPRFILRARMELPSGDEPPVLTFDLVPRTNGWFSVGYLGAPEATLEAIDEMWQPLIWQEKRFPNHAYLTEAARCTLPCTLVAQQGLVWGVAAASEELPFQPMPTPANSRFGVAVRNAAGKAQPAVYAPILGGIESRRNAGEAFQFRLRLLLLPGNIAQAYEKIARDLFRFRDYRQNNGLGSLNRTLERTLDFAMSKWARFDEDLRGSAYETDVPGSVKNVSALHPLGLALVMDDLTFFDHRAKPMIEYVLSREKFLFTTDPKVTGQGASPNLTGPCAPVSELTALYEFSGGASRFLLDYAKTLYGRTRTLNLDDAVRGDSWQNALALYRASGDAQWLARARAGADDYIRRRIDLPQNSFSDGHSRGMFFWTSYAPNWMELYELYEATGERRYLEAARVGARRFAQFVWMCPEIPSGEVRVNQGGVAPTYRKGAKYPSIPIPEETVPAWRVSEIGLTCESSGTSKGHRGIFLATHAPWMLRLGAFADDTFLHDIGRSAVVGRYTSFPGYHMNTARTTVYEKPDFAERPTAQINSTSSLHYNHIWPQAAMLLDYLIADAEARSKGAIRFPSHFSEGYAYLQIKVYGDRPGSVYGQTNAWLWMPKGLLSLQHPEVNYIAAREGDTLFLVLMNQSSEKISTTGSLNQHLVGLNWGVSTARIWQDNQPIGSLRLEAEKFKVDLAPNGLTVLAISGATMKTRLQARMGEPTPWSKETAELASTKAKAMVLNFGQDRQWAYVYLQGREGIREARLHYSMDGRPAGVATDRAFPFEFSVGLPAATREMSFWVETVGSDGTVKKSEEGKLQR